jgi:hypothetical protein
MCSNPPNNDDTSPLATNAKKAAFVGKLALGKLAHELLMHFGEEAVTAFEQAVGISPEMLAECGDDYLSWQPFFTRWFTRPVAGDES